MRTRLYLLRDDHSVSMVELSSRLFGSLEDFEEACKYYQQQGYQNKEQFLLQTA